MTLNSILLPPHPETGVTGMHLHAQLSKETFLMWDNVGSSLEFSAVRFNHFVCVPSRAWTVPVWPTRRPFHKNKVFFYMYYSTKTEKSWCLLNRWSNLFCLVWAWLGLNSGPHIPGKCCTNQATHFQKRYGLDGLLSWREININPI